MGLYKKKVLKISKGQITPKLIERTDIGILDSSGQTIDGFINSKYGNLSTVPGTKLGYVFGANKVVRGFNINLLDGTDASLIINATDDYLILIDKDGQAISTQISALGKFSPDTLNRVCIAQNNDLIIIASPGNPLYQLSIDSNNVLQFKLFNIDLEDVIKVKTLSNAESNPIVYRDTATSIPDTDLSYFQDNGIGIGDYIQLSQTTATAPSNTFPWNVKQINSLPNPDTFSITDIDVNTIPYPNTYATGDVLSVSAVPNDVVCTITGVNLTTGLPASKTSGTSILIYGIADDGNGTIVAITLRTISPYNGYILKSTDKGDTWTATAITTDGSMRNIAYCNGNFIIVGGNSTTNGVILTSPDGDTWTTRTSGITGALNGVDYKSGIYIVVGDSGVILTSSNLSSWTSQNSGTTNSLSSVVNDGSNFIIVGGSGTILASSNGTSFTSQTSGTTANLLQIRYLKSLFLAVGTNGSFLTSTNGASWTVQNTGTSYTFYDILHNSINSEYGTYSLCGSAGLSNTYIVRLDNSFAIKSSISVGVPSLAACITSDDVNIFVGSTGSIYTQSLTLGAQITLNSPLASYTDDPAGTDLAATGGSGTGLTVDITSSITAATYQDATFTAVKDNICRNIWDDSNWLYFNSWIDQSISYRTNKVYTAPWRVSAVSGYITLTIQTEYITITKPTTYTGTPKQFAEKLLIGLQLDGNAALGVMTIDAITGTTSGNDYRITTISGMTYINFISTAVTTNQTDFTIMFSQISAFDVDYPDSQNNLFATDNFPLTIFFYQQRLVIAGTKLDTAQLIWSQTAAYNNFSDDLSGAVTNAFQLRISGTEYESIQNVMLNQGIQIFTDKSEWLLNDNIITKNSGFLQNSKVGSSIIKPVIGANGITLFIQRNGLGLLGFVFNNVNASFNTPYISLFTDIIDNEIIDMCLKKGYSSNDDVLVYLTLSDGKLVIANYMNDQQIQAFVGQTASNYLQSIQVDTSMLFISNINGSTCIEVLDTNKYTWASYDNFSYNFSNGIVSGLPDQYNGSSVNVYDQNHNFIGEYAVASNTFTIDTDILPTSISEIGFNIHSTFISNPIDINSNTFSLNKTIKNIRLVVNESNNTDYLKINGKNGINYNGFVSYPRPARPLRKQQFTIENDVYPVEIYSMEIEVEA